MNIKYILSFAAGALVGAAVTYKIVKEQYTKIVMEQLESSARSYSKKEEEFSEREAELTKALEDVHMDNYKNITSKLGYTDYTNPNDIPEEPKESKEEKNEDDAPYVITPEEFGMKEGHTLISLTYYSDEVLTDDADEPIDNVDEIIGVESLNYIGEYADNAVYVRNDRLKIDYEILQVERAYAED